MPKYIPHPRQKGKYMCPVCDYGHAVGKSRQAVTNHYNKTHMGGDSKDIESKQVEKNVHSSKISSDSTEPPAISIDSEDNNDEKPSWLNFDTTPNDEKFEHESLPSIATTVLSQWNKTGGMPRTKENLEMFYKQQAKIMRWFFNGVIDPLVSWYGKSLTSNDKFNISRSPQEWELFEGISQQWLEYRQIVLPVTPDVMMGACIGSFYVPQIYKIQKNRDKSKSFSPLGIYRRWRLKKRMKAEARRNPLNSGENVNN